MLNTAAVPLGSIKWCLNNAVSGGLAGFIFNMIIYPYDHLHQKTNQLKMMLQMVHLDATPKFTILEAIKHIYQT